MKRESGHPEVYNLLGKVSRFVEQFEHRQALATLTRLPQILTKKDLFFPKYYRALALAGLEREKEAGKLLLLLSSFEEASPIDRASALAHYANLLCQGGRDYHTAIANAHNAAQTAVQYGEKGVQIAAIARGIAALAFAHKHARTCAEEELDAAYRLAKHLPELRFMHGEILLMFDERQQAKEIFFRCGETAAGKRLANLGQAKIARIEGDFDNAHSYLEAISPLGQSDIPVRTERLLLQMSSQAWQSALSTQNEIIQITPHSDFARRRFFERARLLLHSGQKDKAILAFADIVNENIGDKEETNARRMLRLLSTTRGPKTRHVIRGVGSVAMRQDRCGPACCELLLNYFGQTTKASNTQDVGMPAGGAHIYAIRNYLEAAGFLVRRIEAPLSLMKQLIDKDIPFILSEEHASFSHVSVAVGYNDELEILLIQDPQTHEQKETPYEDLPKLLALSNNGITVAVPQNKSKWVSALESIGGTTETDYMRITDDAFFELQSSHFETAEKLADQAIAIRKNYQYAWICKFHAVRGRIDDAPNLNRRLSNILTQIVNIWPDDEWPRQYVGYAAYEEGRFEAALKAFETACERDPEDGNNWAMIGECLFALNKRSRVKTALTTALRKMPWHPKANERLAMVICNRPTILEAKALNRTARALNPQRAANTTVAVDIAFKEEAFDECMALCQELIDKKTVDDVIIGRYISAAVYSNQVDKAIQLLGLLDLQDKINEELLVVFSFALRQCGHALLARKYAEKALSRNARFTPALCAAGAAMTELREFEEGEELLREACEAQPIYATAIRMLGKNLIHQGRINEGLPLIAGAITLHDSGEARLDLAWAFIMAKELSRAEQAALEAVKKGDLTDAKIREAAALVAHIRGSDAARRLLLEAANARSDLNMAQYPHLCGGGLSPVSIERIVDVAGLASPDITEDALFTLAISAIPRMQYGLRLDLLGGDIKPSCESAVILRQQFGIYDRFDLLQKASSLLYCGDRLSISIKEKRPMQDFGSWDFARLSMIMGLGYAASMVDKNEAWTWMIRSAKSVQLTCRSFSEFGRQYLNGFTSQPGNDSTKLQLHVDSLLSPKSWWQDIPFDTAITSPKRPIDPVVDIQVYPDQPLSAQFSAALSKVASPKTTMLRLLMTPGIYYGDIEIQSKVSLVAEGNGVIIETNNGAPVFSLNSNHAGLQLFGITLRTHNPTKDSPLDAIRVIGGALVAKGCNIEGDRHGLYLAHSNAFANLTGCDIHDSNIGICIENGHATIERCRIRNVKISAAVVKEAASLNATDTIFSDSKRNGIDNQGRLKLSGCCIYRTLENGLTISNGGNVEADCCIIDSQTGVGVHITQTSNKSVFEDCSIVNHPSVNLHFEGSTNETLFRDCVFKDAKTNLLLSPGHHLKLSGCVLSCATDHLVEVQKGNETIDGVAPAFDQCLFKDAAAGIQCQDSSNLKITRSRFENIDAFGLFLTGPWFTQISESVFSQVGKRAILLMDDASLELNQCRFENLPRGVVAEGAGSLTVFETDFEDIEQLAIQLEETTDSQLVDCTVASKKSGLSLNVDSSCYLHGCDIRSHFEEISLSLSQSRAMVIDTNMVNLRATNQSHAWMVRTFLSDAAAGAVTIEDHSSLTLEQSIIEKFDEHGVFSGKHSSTILKQCEILNMNEGGEHGVVATQGGEAWIYRSTIKGGSGAAAKAASKGTIALFETNLIEGDAGKQISEDAFIENQAMPSHADWPHQLETTGPSATLRLSLPDIDNERKDRLQEMGFTPTPETFEELLKTMVSIRYPEIREALTFRFNDQSLIISGSLDHLMLVQEMAPDLFAANDLMPHLKAVMTARTPGTAWAQHQKQEPHRNAEDTLHASVEETEQQDEATLPKPGIGFDTTLIEFVRSGVKLEMEQRWILAIASPYLAVVGGNLDKLDGGKGLLKRHAAKKLHEHNIHTTSELNKKLDQLINQGGDVEQQYQAALLFDKKNSETPDSHISPEAVGFHPAKNANLSTVIKIATDIEAIGPDRGLRSFGATTAAWLALLGMNTGLINRETAWERMTHAAQVVKRTAPAFLEWLNDVKWGLKFEAALKNTPIDTHWIEIVDALGKQTDSPISDLDWNVDFSKASPPRFIPPRHIKVHTDDELEEALETVKDNEQLILARGTYTGPLVLDKNIFLLAENPGTVAIKSEHGYGIVCAADMIEVSGVEIFSDSEEAAVLIRVESGHLILNDCTLTRGDIGIEVSKECSAHIQNTYFEQCGTALLGRGRWIGLNRCSIADCLYRAAYLLANCQIYIHQSQISSWKTGGLLILQNASAHIEQAQLLSEFGQSVTLLDNGALSMHQCVVKVKNDLGVVADTQGKLVLKKVDFSCQKTAVSIKDCPSSAVIDCTIEVDNGPAVDVQGTTSCKFINNQTNAKRGPTIQNRLTNGEMTTQE